jgi:hypothetical protein
MFLTFAFCFISRHFCSRNLSITAADNAWGGFSLGWGVMECRKEAARMMVRDGAVLMRGGGRNKNGKRTESGGGVMAGKVQTN